jgi:hypothetical protein
MAIATIGASAVSTPAQADTVVRGVTIPAFYTPPPRLPAANGALVRTAPLKLAISLPSLSGQPVPGTATRIMYRSTDQQGQAVAVTGAYIEPSAAWTGAGPRPLIVVAAGTQGQGDQCAPSLGLERPLTVGDGTFAAAYETLAIYRLLHDTGAAVVVTDYVGLGTTDRLHTYVNRVDQGHAVLDAARAAIKVPGASVTVRSPVGLYGYSQGGGAVASAAELQASYAPEVRLKATYAGAPPADLASVTRAIDGTELAGAIAWAVNGFVQTEPSFKPLLDTYLSSAGRSVLKDLSTMCTPDAVAKYATTKSSSWTTTGTSIADIIKAEPAIRSFVDSQRIGRIKPTGVVRVATGIYDNLVPHAQARTLASDWCTLGGTVVYAPIDQLNGSSPLLNHAAPLLTDQGKAITWLRDRLSGQRAWSNCRLLPFLK